MHHHNKIKSLLPSALRLQPGSIVQCARQLLPRRLDISSIALLRKPREHRAQFSHHVHDQTSDEAIGARQLLPCLLSEDSAELCIRQAVTSNAHSSPAPLIWLQQRFRSKLTDISRSDELQWFVCRQPDLHHGWERPALEVVGEVFEERDWTQDRVAHVFAIVLTLVLSRLSDKVLLDVVLGQKVGDVGWVPGGALVAAALDGGEDEVLHAVGEGAVDEGFALCLFFLCVAAEGCLQIVGSVMMVVDDGEILGLTVTAKTPQMLSPMDRKIASGLSKSPFTSLIVLLLAASFCADAVVGSRVKA
jgi:hypothetical protein